jgi:hypothetical protein
VNASPLARLTVSPDLFFFEVLNRMIIHPFLVN